MRGEGGIVSQVDGELGPWMHSGRREGPAPHRSPADHGVAITLDPIWADASKSAIVAVADYDGCQALVLRIEPRP